MKIKITKIAGGVIPDGFWVEGEGDMPEKDKLYYVRNVAKTSATTMANVPMNWFQTRKIERIIGTDYGYMLFTSEAMWIWRVIP